MPPRNKDKKPLDGMTLLPDAASADIEAIGAAIIRRELTQIEAFSKLRAALQSKDIQPPKFSDFQRWAIRLEGGSRSKAQKRARNGR